MYTNWIKDKDCCFPPNGNIGFRDIEGCRNGIKVTKRILVNLNVGCDFKHAFSDGGTEISDGSGNPGIWLDQPCTNEHDEELTCVAENDQIYRLRFDVLTGSYVIWDFNGLDVTGTVTPVKCARDLESDKITLYDNCNPFYRWIVKEDGKPTGVFFDTEFDGQPYAVVGVVTEYPCGLEPVLDGYVSIVSGGDNDTYTPSQCVRSVSIGQNGPNLLQLTFTFTTAVGGNLTQSLPWRGVNNYTAPDGVCIQSIRIDNTGLDPVTWYVNAMN